MPSQLTAESLSTAARYQPPHTTGAPRSKHFGSTDPRAGSCEPAPYCPATVSWYRDWAAELERQAGLTLFGARSRALPLGASLSFLRRSSPLDRVRIPVHNRPDVGC